MHLRPRLVLSNRLDRRHRRRPELHIPRAETPPSSPLPRAPRRRGGQVVGKGVEQFGPGVMMRSAEPLAPPVHVVRAPVHQLVHDRYTTIGICPDSAPRFDIHGRNPPARRELLLILGPTPGRLRGVVDGIHRRRIPVSLLGSLRDQVPGPHRGEQQRLHVQRLRLAPSTRAA